MKYSTDKMQDIEKIVINVSEKYKYGECEYCIKTKTPKRNLATDYILESAEKQQNEYTIDNRIVLFGWRLRLASGKCNSFMIIMSV